MIDLPRPLFATPLEYWEDYRKHVLPEDPLLTQALRHAYLTGMAMFDMHVHRLTRSNPVDGGAMLVKFRQQLLAMMKEEAPK